MTKTKPAPSVERAENVVVSLSRRTSTGGDYWALVVKSWDKSGAFDRMEVHLSDERFARMLGNIHDGSLSPARIWERTK